jgi:diaminopimelate epimerase
MLVSFNKYHGTGNDFIIVDNRQVVIESGNEVLINKLCDRRLGIGADGLMLLSAHDQFDFEMRYFNSDGMEGSLCGNGARCIASFAHTLGIAGNSMKFKAYDGIHEAFIENDGVTIKMNDVTGVENNGEYFFLDTGSPHAVLFRTDVRTMDVFEEGKKIRHDKQFLPGGTNVNFVQQEENILFVRSYERGVESETLSCGTGVVASAICAVSAGKIERAPISIQTRGGDLKVNLTMVSKDQFTSILLSGPVCSVFEGKIEI